MPNYTPAQKMPLPPSLVASQNIPGQRRRLISFARNMPFGASAASYCRLGCEAWIKRREMESAT
jgi:hypothetical protein